MISAFFTPYCKFLQKDNYLKFFEVDNLQDLIDKVKVKDKIKIYAYSKDIIKFQFSNSDSDISYQFLEEDSIFTEIIKSKDVVSAIVKEEWRNILGEKIYLIQDRAEQLRVVKDKDILVFQFTDLVDLVKNLFDFGDIGVDLVIKMNFTDKEIAENDLYLTKV